MKIKRRRIRKKNQKERRRGIYILPNLVTTAGLFCGFYAVISSISGNFYQAAISILVAAVLDGLDGRIARLTRTTSTFGIQYDSLSDLVTFGLAPGVMVFLKPFNRLGWVAAFLYVVCGALRLARFNVQVGQVNPKYFVGLPIPAAAGIVGALILFLHQIGGGGSSAPLAVLILIFVLSFLMVSKAFVQFSGGHGVDLRFGGLGTLCHAGGGYFDVCAFRTDFGPFAPEEETGTGTGGKNGMNTGPSFIKQSPPMPGAPVEGSVHIGSLPFLLLPPRRGKGKFFLL